MSLKQNKTWQFLVGCFCIFLAYKCWSLGIIQWFYTDDTEGFENVSLIPLILTAVVSAIQMVGLIAIMLVSGLQTPAEKTVDYLRSKIPKLDRAAQVIEGKVDAEKLVSTLNDLDERIRSIEIKVGDDK